MRLQKNQLNLLKKIASKQSLGGDCSVSLHLLNYIIYRLSLKYGVLFITITVQASGVNKREYLNFYNHRTLLKKKKKILIFDEVTKL